MSITSRGAEILICLHCGHQYGEDLKTLPARSLRRDLKRLLQERDPAADLCHVRGVTCVGFCDNREVVVFQGLEKETLVFGDIVPAQDEAALIEAFLSYRNAAPRRRMRKEERPESLQDKLVARIPALKKERNVKNS